MGWASRQLEVQRSEVAAGKRKSVDVGLANQAVQEDREDARADEHHRAAVARANEDQLTLQRESLAQDERHALESRRSAVEALRVAEQAAQEQRDFQRRMQTLEEERAEDTRAHNERLFAEMEQESERNEAHRSSMRALERERIGQAKASNHLTSLRMSPSYRAATRLLELRQLEWPSVERKELENLLMPAVALNKRMVLKFNTVISSILREEVGKKEELETLFKDAFQAEREAIEVRAGHLKEAEGFGFAWFGKSAQRRRESKQALAESERQVAEAGALTAQRRGARDEFAKSMSAEEDLVRAVFKAHCHDEMDRLEDSIVSWFTQSERSSRLVSFFDGQLKNAVKLVVDIDLCCSLDELRTAGQHGIIYPGLGLLPNEAELGRVVARIHTLRAQADPLDEPPTGWNELLWLASAREFGTVGTGFYIGNPPPVFINKFDFDFSGEREPDGGKGFFA